MIRRGASILVVDDDPDIVDVVRTFLEPLGFEVATASEADQAIGAATADIEAGDWVHLHNMKSNYISSHTRSSRVAP